MLSPQVFALYPNGKNSSHYSLTWAGATGKKESSKSSGSDERGFWQQDKNFHFSPQNFFFSFESKMYEVRDRNREREKEMKKANFFIMLCFPV